MTSTATKRLLLGGAALALTGVGIALAGSPASAAPTGALSLQISKVTVTDLDHNARIDPGDRLNYTFVVDNQTGATLTDLQITDAALGHITCPDSTIPDGMAFRCHIDSPYSLGIEDVDSGQFATTAIATATSPDAAQVSSAPATSTTPIAAQPSLKLKFEPVHKTDVNGNGQLDAGDTLAYSLLLTNTGNVTVKQVTVSDEKSSGVTCVHTPGPVDIPSAMPFRCLGNLPYTITARDVARGVVFNPAVAFGTAVQGGAVQTSTVSKLPLRSTATATRTAASATASTSDTTASLTASATASTIANIARRILQHFTTYLF